MFGAADAIDGIVRRIKASGRSREEPLVVATGGLAEMFAPLCDEFDGSSRTSRCRACRWRYALLSRRAEVATAGRVAAANVVST